jgi:beta-1,4-N-acetylglucosaminyltransferase
VINIFITVGTTEFDSLIKTVDEAAMKLSHCNIIAQRSSSSNYIPSNIEHFMFSENIDSYIESADLIVTHAGAGSVYSMLEIGKNLIVVPNLSRVDQHQLELANYVESHNFGKACTSLEELPLLLSTFKNRVFNKYEKDDFFGAELIKSLLL